MRIGVSIAITIGGPQMIGAFANCLFQILHVKAPTLRCTSGAVTWLTNCEGERLPKQVGC
jgi:hypothetical protein